MVVFLTHLNVHQIFYLPLSAHIKARQRHHSGTHDPATFLISLNVSISSILFYRLALKRDGDVSERVLDGVVSREGDSHRDGALYPVHTQPFEEAAPAFRPESNMKI